MATLSVEPNWPSEFPLRHFEDGEKRSWALFSPCERYRYRLRREWGKGDAIAFLMLNPSTADEVKNDPTVERCERRARALGFSGFEVVNIFALRSTDPKGLYIADDPVGAENDKAILEAIENTKTAMAAWGAHGALGGRSDAVRALLKGQKLAHLGLTKAGEPRHPLYISYAQALEFIEL